jgi:broad specificity phosphatase PhoE
MTDSHVPAPTILILVRHGQTASNIHGLLHGQVDVPLTPLGIAQAHAVAALLGQEEGIAAIYSSPLERAQHTATIIGGVTSHTPIIHPGLLEIHFGEAEGLSVDEAWVRYPHLRPSDDDGSGDLQWPGGESRHGFNTRVRETIGEIISQHQGEKIVIATHGGVIGRAVCTLLADESADWLRYLVGNCSLTQFTWERPGADPTLVCLDDQAHLEGLVTTHHSGG